MNFGGAAGNENGNGEGGGHVRPPSTSADAITDEASPYRYASLLRQFPIKAREKPDFYLVFFLSIAENLLFGKMEKVISCKLNIY